MIQILIVDDGSTKDNTAEIADRYEKEYPGICKAIHQAAVIAARGNKISVLLTKIVK